MKFLAALSASAFLVFSSATAQQSVIRMTMGKNARPFHMPLGFEGKSVVTTIAIDDYWTFVMDICTALKVECDFHVRHADTGNAHALIYRDGRVDTRVIVYDRRLSPILGLEGAYAVLGHEIGHHICGHTRAFAGDNWKQELQADRIAGAALKSNNFPISSIENVLAIFSARGCASHPPVYLRRDALRNGWSNPNIAVSCN